jgi:hypothetical protein
MMVSKKNAGWLAKTGWLAVGWKKLFGQYQLALGCNAQAIFRVVMQDDPLIAAFGE